VNIGEILTMADDVAGDPSTTGFFSLLANANAPVSGVIEVADDSDWFRIDSFQRWYDYHVLLYWPDSGERLENAQVRMHNLAGTELWSKGADLTFGNPITPRPANQSVLAPGRRYNHEDPSGQYFLSVTGFGKRIPGRYSLYVRTVDHAGSDAATALRLGFDARPFQASALERFGDLDWYSCYLRAGIDYVLDLLGAASFVTRGTTLTDPILRLFDPESRQVKGDNDSGEGNNARLAFNVPQSGRYYLQVSGNNHTAGSYIIESAQFDDLPDDNTTPGRLVPGGPEFTGRTDFDFDYDTLSVLLTGGITCEFTVATVTAEIRLRSATGDLAWSKFVHPGDSGPLRVQVPATHPGTYYLEVSGGTGEESAWTARVARIDDYAATFAGAWLWNYTAPFLSGYVETALDRDFFRGNLVPFGLYSFHVEPVGSTPLASPGIGLWGADSSLLVSPTSGPIWFTAPQTPALSQPGIRVQKCEPTARAAGFLRETRR
jgi:Bacterial pre-peptidase C-terminal domain